MRTYRFPTAGMARRFARNARGRGYSVKVAGPFATVSEAGPGLGLLVERYAGLPANDAQLSVRNNICVKGELHRED